MEDILDKVAKLLAKAKGTNNENEAAIFAAKAAELMARHNLDEAMVAEHTGRDARGPIGGHNYDGRVPDRWRELILQGCAKLYFCRLTCTRGHKRFYTLYGRQSNATVAKLMADYLFATVKRMAREYSEDKARQNDFRKGAGIRLYQRLVELYNTQNIPVASGNNPDNLPALYEAEDKEIVAWMDENLNLKPGPKPMRLGLGALAGQQAADGINLTTQVGTSAKPRQIA